MTTVKELKAQAKARGIKGFSTMRKADLEKALSKPPPKPPRTKSKAEQAKNPVKQVQAPKKAPAKKQSFTAFMKANKDKYDDFLSDELDDIGSNAYQMTKEKERQMTKQAKINAKEKMRKLYEKSQAPAPKKAPAKGGFKIAVSKITNSMKGAEYIVSLSRTGKVEDPRKSGKDWVFTGHDNANVSLNMGQLKRELAKVLKGESSFEYSVDKLAYLLQRPPTLKLEESKKFLVSKYPQLVGLPAKYARYSRDGEVEVGTKSTGEYSIRGVGLNIQPFIRKKGEGKVENVGRAPVDLYKFDQL